LEQHFSALSSKAEMQQMCERASARALTETGVRVEAFERQVFKAFNNIQKKTKSISRRINRVSLFLV
jgi:hypothetical protein